MEVFNKNRNFFIIQERGKVKEIKLNCFVIQKMLYLKAEKK